MNKISKNQIKYIQNLRERNKLSWSEVALKFSKKYKVLNNIKLYNRIRKAGWRASRVLPVVDSIDSVEEILNPRKIGLSFEYQVKWVNSDILTWEPKNNLLLSEEVVSMVREFDEYLTY